MDNDRSDNGWQPIKSDELTDRTSLSTRTKKSVIKEGGYIYHSQSEDGRSRRLTGIDRNEQISPDEVGDGADHEHRKPKISRSVG